MCRYYPMGNLLLQHISHPHSGFCFCSEKNCFLLRELYCFTDRLKKPPLLNTHSCSSVRTKAQTGSVSHPGGVSRAGHRRGMLISAVNCLPFPGEHGNKPHAGTHWKSLSGFVDGGNGPRLSCSSPQPLCHPIVPESLFVATKPCRLTFPATRPLR